MIQPERIQFLNDLPVRPGRYVLYWMQQSQRADFNHALEYAIERADVLSLPVLTVFGLSPSFPEANLRHYTFMLEGLRETKENLDRRGIQMVVLADSPERAALMLAPSAALVVTDRGYLRVQKRWRMHVAANAPCQVVQVESDVVVPVEVASDKEEYAARTIRPRIHRHFKHFLVALPAGTPRRDSLGFSLPGLDINDVGSVLGSLSLDASVGPVASFRGGPGEARRHLKRFIRTGLARYGRDHGDPGLDCVSHMSPYLHFGQISPLHVALRVLKARGAKSPSAAAYLEELIVRRELSMNFVHFNAHYDRYSSLPGWARATLRMHRGDRRAYRYARRTLEAGRTHDPYWNAAQREMVLTGKMHGYMRMYWGKKLIEWSGSPEQAFRTALYLNNRYELDGRDPNGFAGVAWCFGKHDRPWSERAVFGMVRYMNAEGLQRKFDMDGYVERVEALGRV